MSSEVSEVSQNKMDSAEGTQNVKTSAENNWEESLSAIKNEEMEVQETNVESKNVKEEQEVTKEEEEEEDDECNENGCKVCNVTFTSAHVYHVHVRLTSHIQRLLSKQKHAYQISCDVCCINFASKEEYNTHMSGTPHHDKLRSIQEKHFQQVKMELDKKEKLADSVKSKAEKKQTGEELRWKAVEWVRKAILSTPGITDDNVTENSITCKICELSCSGVLAFKAHLEGARHNKKVRKLVETEVIDPDTLMRNGGGEMRPSMVGSSGGILQIRHEIADCTQPLVGLEYMTEYQGVDGLAEESKYLCDLCMSRMPRDQVIPHVTGVKHRHKFFKEYDMEKYMILWDINPRSGKAAKAALFAQEVEDNKGRGVIKVKVHQPSSNGYDPMHGRYCKNDDDDEYHGGRSVWTRHRQRSPHRRDANVAKTILKDLLSDLNSVKRTRGLTRRYGDRYDDDGGEVFGVDLHRRSVERGGGGHRRYIDKRPADVEFIKRCITSCSQENEPDTEIALHISNALTQGLLEFRLKHMDPTSVLNGELRSQFESLKRQNSSLISNNLDSQDRSAMGRALREAQKLSLEMSNGDEKLMSTCLSILEVVNQKLSGMVDNKSKPPVDPLLQNLMTYPANPTASSICYPTNNYANTAISSHSISTNPCLDDTVSCVSYPTNPYATHSVSSNAFTSNNYPQNSFLTNNFTFNPFLNNIFSQSSFPSNIIPPTSYPSNNFLPNPLQTNTFPSNPTQPNTFLSNPAQTNTFPSNPTQLNNFLSNPAQTNPFLYNDVFNFFSNFTMPTPPPPNEPYNVIKKSRFMI